jgi:hypothetical protein
MKKYLILVLLLTIFPVLVFSQTLKFSSGAGIFLVNYMDGGAIGDIAFLIFNKNFLDIRNHFVIRGGTLLNDSGGLLSISEKISLGGLVENKYRVYGYFEGGVGFWGNGNKEFFKTPLTYTFGGGGGTDIFLVKRYSIYFEAGVLVHLLGNENKNSTMLQIGWKYWL